MCQIERVRYGKCPLIEAVYQLNFPTILSIEAEMPARFQNEIRKAFPQYQIQTEQENEITVNVTGEDINPMFRHRPVRKLHQFISEDGMWKITLAKNQLAISTLKYEQWEDMMERFKQPLKAFTEIYDQTYFERVGLRYVDAINRSELGLEGTEWRELIKPHLLGCLAFAQEEVTKVNLNTLRAEIVIDGIFVRISSGLGVINTNNKKPDNAFILDCDYYQTGKVDIDKVEEVTWYDNQDAFNVIMAQKSDRRDEIQFKAGVAELDRIEIATKMKAHFLSENLSYERRPTSNNQYHGNLLVKNSISKQMKRLIKCGLATLANDKIYPNPNVQDC